MLNRISVSSSSKAEGIGLAVSNIRSRQSNVGKSNGKAGGILKYLKVVNEALRFWNQRGKKDQVLVPFISNHGIKTF
jgi:ribonucleotide reductase alpha subunit